MEGEGCLQYFNSNTGDIPVSTAVFYYFHGVVPVLHVEEAREEHAVKN